MIKFLNVVLTKQEIYYDLWGLSKESKIRKIWKSISINRMEEKKLMTILADAEKVFKEFNNHSW